MREGGGGGYRIVPEGESGAIAKAYSAGNGIVAVFVLVNVALEVLYHFTACQAASQCHTICRNPPKDADRCLTCFRSCSNRGAMAFGFFPSHPIPL